MPELPDVEYLKDIFQKTSLYKIIKGVEVKGEKILEGTTPKRFTSWLEGESFSNVLRHGKYLFARISEKGWMVMHFGMTGDLAYRDASEKVPEYTKIIFRFPHSFLSYICVRKLGNVRIINKKEKFIKEKELGPDALRVDFKTFYQRVKNSRAMLKSVLMDQSIVSGIGNVYADEVCFYFKEHPKTKVTEFEKDDWQRILQVIKEVLRKAREVILNEKEIPSEWLTSHRGKEDVRCPRCGGKIKRIEVSGRGTYFCPSCQKR